MSGKKNYLIIGFYLAFMLFFCVFPDLFYPIHSLHEYECLSVSKNYLNEWGLWLTFLTLGSIIFAVCGAYSVRYKHHAFFNFIRENNLICENKDEKCMDFSRDLLEFIKWKKREVGCQREKITLLKRFIENRCREADLNEYPALLREIDLLLKEYFDEKLGCS